MIDLTSKLGEINDIEHDKGSKVYPQNQVILDCIMPSIQLKHLSIIFLLFLIGKNRHGIGKKGGYFRWGWGRNSAPREGQKILYKLIMKKSFMTEPGLACDGDHTFAVTSLPSSSCAVQCSHSHRIARDSLGNCKNHAHFLGPKREFTHVFSLKMYRKSSLFIHSTASLTSFILFRYLMLF